MTIKKLMELINDEYKAIFPQSTSYVKNGAFSSGDDEACSLTTFLGNKNTFSNGISDNDQMIMIFWIFKPVDENGKYTIEISANRGLTINPSNPIFAMEKLKISFRKKTNTPEKLVIAMRKHFMKMHDIVCENRDNIYDNQKLIEYGII